MYDFIMLIIIAVSLGIIIILTPLYKKKYHIGTKQHIYDHKHFLGQYGESLIVSELELLGVLGGNQQILRNIYVPKDNDETSEVDVIFITPKGVFVIESKYFSGWIFGNEKDFQWTATLPNQIRNKFYNPIRQNYTHIKYIAEYLKQDIPFFSLIVFSEKCELKKIIVNQPKVYVIKLNYLYDTIRNIWNESKDVLSDEQVNEIYEKLKPLANANEATQRAHIDTIEQKYKQKHVVTEVPVKEQAVEEKTVQEQVVEANTAQAQAVDENTTQAQAVEENTVQEQVVDENTAQAQAVEENTVQEQVVDENTAQAQVVDENTAQAQAVEENTVQEQEKTSMCPFCGGQLVLRTAKKGANAGKQFYGCSGFPKCRYIKNL